MPSLICNATCYDLNHDGNIMQRKGNNTIKARIQYQNIHNSLSERWKDETSPFTSRKSEKVLFIQPLRVHCKRYQIRGAVHILMAMFEIQKLKNSFQSILERLLEA